MYVVEYMEDGQVRQAEMLGEEREIRAKMYREGKVVLSVRKPIFLVFRRVRTEEVVAVFTAMGDVICSGHPLTRAIGDVAMSVDKSTRLPFMLNQIKGNVESGAPLSRALKGYKEIFGSTVISMVAAGENSGKLGETLITAAEYLRKMLEVRKEMYRRLTYPVTVFLGGMLMLLVNTKVTIPMLMKSEKMSAAGAKNAIYLDALRGLAWLVPAMFAAGVLVAVLIFVLYRQNQEATERWLEKMPLFREFVFYREYYISFSSLANLIAVGVRRDAALEIVANSTYLCLVRQQFLAARESMKNGLPFVNGLKMLGPVERTMLDTAQNEDRIERNLRRVADRFYELYINKVQALTPKIYAMFTIFAVVIVFLMAMGVILPYVESLGEFK